MVFDFHDFGRKGTFGSFDMDLSLNRKNPTDVFFFPCRTFHLDCSLHLLAVPWRGSNSSPILKMKDFLTPQQKGPGLTYKKGKDHCLTNIFFFHFLLVFWGRKSWCDGKAFHSIFYLVKLICLYVFGFIAQL